MSATAETTREQEIAAEEMAAHLANAPETWQVVKDWERVWQVRRIDGAVITTCKTRREAQAETAGGFYFDLWHKQLRWMRGERVHPWKPYAEHLAEAVRREGWQRQLAAIQAAGYERVWLDDSAPCSGGGHELPAERPAWGNGDGRLWCRAHLLAAQEHQPATA